MKRKAPKPEPAMPVDAPMLIGYARVSTDEQDVRHQVHALKAAGCHHIYTDTVSGRAKKRVVLERLLRDLRPQDTLVVTQLDRLARSTIHWHKIMQEIYDAGATFKSLKEDFVFTTSIGKLVLGLLSLVAEFEVNLISDRTKSGLVAARAAGKQIGQVRIVTDELKAKIAKRWTMKDRKGEWKYTTKEVADHFGISTSSINNRMPGGREAYVVKRPRTVGDKHSADEYPVAGRATGAEIYRNRDHDGGSNAHNGNGGDLGGFWHDLLLSASRKPLILL